MIRTTKRAACPQCNHQIDFAIGIARGQVPRPDDFTICRSCALVLRFNHDLSVRRATLLELDAIDLDLYSRILEGINWIRLHPLRTAVGARS